MAGSLLDHVENSGVVSMPLTQQDIANRVGVSRRAVARSTAVLRNRQIVCASRLRSILAPGSRIGPITWWGGTKREDHRLRTVARQGAMNTLRPGPPRHRSIFAVDIEGSTTETNAAKAWLREAMYLLMERTLLASGIAEEHRDELVDRGDGILALIHPVDSVPKTLLLTAVVPTLDRLLHEYADLHPDRRLRLRAVLHAGEVHHDGRGCFGEALDVSFRLLDSPEVKRIFRKSFGHLLLVVSDHIFQTVIRHDYDGIDRHAFVPIAPVSVGGHLHAGWVRLTTGDVDVERRRVPRLVRVARRLESHEHLA